MTNPEEKNIVQWEDPHENSQSFASGLVGEKRSRRGEDIHSPTPSLPLPQIVSYDSEWFPRA